LKYPQALVLNILLAIRVRTVHWSDRIGRRLKPHELHVFLAVVEHGNMAKAAQHLSISRPVVSKAIASLERVMGVRLLDRTSSGVEPTRYGNALFRRGIGLFDELRQTVRELEFLADPNRGELRVGCTEVTAAGLVAALVANITKQFPGLRIRTELGSVVQQYPPLRERRCELFVARAPASAIESDMQREVLFYDWPLVAVGPHSSWVGRRKVTLADLSQEKWIVSPGEAVGDGLFESAYKGAGLSTPKPAILSDSLSLRNSLLAKADNYVTFIPGSVLHFGPSYPSLKVLPIKLKPWKLPICVVTLKGKTLSPEANLFIAHAREMAKNVRR
jgi:DNA-binding transcriptional LysR family regulator